ncbi:MAG: hypothetical protein A4S09_03380 [Proteobacteria bacterium SG_bin7]|nr:MAG: hypothetical protein A4S09_03380 [Proteobacteria bacterium SG_bin7]
MASNEIDADLHNFGNRVELIERAHETWFCKPRTVYWEWLFFGKGSPLKRFFDFVGPSGTISFADCIFNLDVEPVHHWLGYSKKVNTCTDLEPLKEHFYSFGVLLAYTYIFGIRDLHRRNLVFTKTHLQVVDAEVVLTRLILPNETILLPFKQVTWQDSGIGELLPNGPDHLSRDNAKAILDGYVEMFQHIIKNQERILEELKGVVDNKVPVRVLVRNTPDYYSAIDNTDFLPEEISQLNRRDIPYFFKKLGNDSLYWLQSPSVDGEVQSLGRFKADIDRHADSLPRLLGTDLLNDARLVQGLFLICRKLNLKETYSLSCGACVSAESIRMSTVDYKLTPAQVLKA